MTARSVSMTVLFRRHVSCQWHHFYQSKTFLYTWSSEPEVWWSWHVYFDLWVWGMRSFDHCLWTCVALSWCCHWRGCWDLCLWCGGRTTPTRMRTASIGTSPTACAVTWHPWLETSSLDEIVHLFLPLSFMCFVWLYVSVSDNFIGSHSALKVSNIDMVTGLSIKCVLAIHVVCKVVMSLSIVNDCQRLSLNVNDLDDTAKSMTYMSECGHCQWLRVNDTVNDLDKINNKFAVYV